MTEILNKMVARTQNNEKYLVFTQKNRGRHTGPKSKSIRVRKMHDSATQPPPATFHRSAAPRPVAETCTMFQEIRAHSVHKNVCREPTSIETPGVVDMAFGHGCAPDPSDLRYVRPVMAYRHQTGISSTPGPRQNWQGPPPPGEGETGQKKSNDRRQPAGDRGRPAARNQVAMAVRLCLWKGAAGHHGLPGGPAKRSPLRACLLPFGPFSNQLLGVMHLTLARAGLFAPLEGHCIP